MQTGDGIDLDPLPDEPVEGKAEGQRQRDPRQPPGGTEFGLQTGTRRIYVYTKDVADNVSLGAGLASMTFDTSPPPDPTMAAPSARLAMRLFISLLLPPGVGELQQDSSSAAVLLQHEVGHAAAVREEEHLPREGFQDIIKQHPLLLSQSLAYRTVIATAKGDPSEGACATAGCTGKAAL